MGELCWGSWSQRWYQSRKHTYETAQRNLGIRPESEIEMNTAVEVAESVRSGQRQAVEVLETCLAAIQRLNPQLNAFVHLDPASARRDAERIDSLVKAGQDPGPLAGVPFGVKDLEDCAGMPTSYGSLLYKGSPPAESDSIHVARLRSAGAIPVGKTAVPEFGAVALTDTRGWGPTRNPWNPARTPGGSSGGSAAAVAAGMVPMCTAADGGGSIRIPASFSGLLGFKPSFGRIPHPGNQPSATDVFGALVTTVADAARHLDVATGPHDCDRFTLPSPDVSFERSIETVPTEGLKAVWSVDLGFAVVDHEVASLTESAAGALIEAAGLERVEHPVEFTDPVRLWQSNGVLDLYMDLEPGMWPERGSEMMEYVSIPLSRADEVKPARIAAIWKRRQKLDNELAALFDGVDVLITPTAAVPAFAAEWPMPSEINGTKVHPAMNVPFTMLANLGWQPAVSLPAGMTSEGLPVGVQVVCRRHADALVLRLARIFEQARPWPRLAPI
jgi:aspartyl-tRNA(Asn)/glutamyl-tRNA(Gln) amidotransferase subunit A